MGLIYFEAVAGNDQLPHTAKWKPPWTELSSNTYGQSIEMAGAALQLGDYHPAKLGLKWNFLPSHKDEQSSFGTQTASMLH